MKLRSYISVLIVLVAFCSEGQDFSLGGTFGLNGFQKLSLNTSIYSPDTTYHTYLEPTAGAGLIDKNSYVNGFHLGAAVKFHYKRFSVFWEPQFYYQRTVVKFEQPLLIERVFAKKGFRMPLYFTYKFFKKENSMFSVIGLTYNKERNWDYQNPGVGYYLGDEVLYNNNIDLGNGHFYDVLYNEQGYWHLTAGLGRKIGRFNTSLRYHKPLGMDKRGLSGNTWMIELSLNFFFLNTKEITQKHYLYVE